MKPRVSAFPANLPFRRILAAALPALFLLATPALAQTLTLDMGESDGSAAGRIVQYLGLITVLSVAPSILIMTTSFTRIVVVLSLLRSAIGAQQTPPNTVLVSLALFLSAFIMAPTFETAYNQGIKPLINQEITEMEAFDKASAPIKGFMLKHARSEDVQLFVDISKEGPWENVSDIPGKIVAPAFMISELRRAFEIGFLLFIPFLVIDMVVASILMSMGMMMVPPAVVSLPFKLIFFVLVDGWHLVVGSLIRSYGGG